MAAPNRYAIRDVATATFYSLVSPYNAIVTLSTLKTSGVQTKSTTVYARGGSGNAKIVGFSSDKEATITLQDAIFDNLLIAQLTGNAITTGVTTVDQIYVGTVTSTSHTITIPNKIKSITSVYLLDTDGVTNKTLLTADAAAAEGTKYSIAGQVITTAETSTMNVRVYYKADTDATAKTIKVTSDAFGGSFKLVLDCLVRDEATKADFEAQLVVFNGKVEDDWSMEFKADGDPSVIDLKVEVLKNPLNTDMWQLIIYDESLIPTS